MIGYAELGQPHSLDVVFPIINVSAWPARAEEPAGDDEKEWLVDPEGVRWLFKPRKEHEDPAWSQGEDWAEKAASEIARLLRVPAAEVELAQRGQSSGLISRNLRPSGWELQPGDVALFELLGDYTAKTLNRVGHTIINIESILSRCEPPPEFGNEGGLDAFGVFTGYLVMDALIANRDRHEQNWAILRPRSGNAEMRLAGSFDHASALGFNLKDEARLGYLDRDGISAWAERGSAHRFEHADKGSIPTLVAVARDAAALAGEAVRSYWRERVASVTEEALSNVICQIPVMSDVSRRFVVELLKVNRRRLLDGPECL